ncbi:Peptide methionine sulfoxide reductase MsrA [Mannheimia haemolytica]
MKYNQLLLCLVSAIFTTSSIANITTPNEMRSENLQDIYLAGGCFWGIEAYMEKIYGVKEATSGYANGKTEQTAYRIIGQTDHAETVHVTYELIKFL